MRKATRSYHIYLFLVNLQSWFMGLQWKTCLWTELQTLVPTFAVKDLPLAEHPDGDDDIQILNKNIFESSVIFADLPQHNSLNRKFILNNTL